MKLSTMYDFGDMGMSKRGQMFRRWSCIGDINWISRVVVGIRWIAWEEVGE